jgi:cytochrome P450
MGRLTPAEQSEAAPLREILTNRLVLSDNPDHARVRALMQQAFTPRRVELMRPAVESIANELLESFPPGQRVDLIADYADPLAARGIAHMLGLPPEDRLRFKGWTDDIYAFIGISAEPLSVRARRGTASAMELRAYLEKLFADRRQRPRDDLLTAMVVAEEQGERLTQTELFSNVVGMLNASHETTTNLIGNTILALLRRPEQWRRLTSRPELAADAVEEGLRFDSPVQMLLRRAAEDVPIGDTTVPRGDKVLVALGAANRDPVVFPDPDEFDMARDGVKHVAFGGGPHFCLGAALGRLEGTLAVEALSRRLPYLRLTAEPLHWRPLPIFRGLRELPVMV